MSDIADPQVRQRLNQEPSSRPGEARAGLLRRCRRAMVEALLTRGTATTDDARDAVSIPHGIDPKLAGAIYRPLVDGGVMRAANMVATRRKIAQGRRIIRFALADRDAAIAWLSANPELTGESDQGPRQRGLFD